MITDKVLFKSHDNMAAGEGVVVLGLVGGGDEYSRHA